MDALPGVSGSSTLWGKLSIKVLRIPSVNDAPFVRIVHYLLLLICERVFSIRIDSLNALDQSSLPMTIVTFCVLASRGRILRSCPNLR